MTDNTVSPQFSPIRQLPDLSLTQSGIRGPRTPRRSITPRQAVDSLELALTQSNDLQHLFEKYINQVNEQTINIRVNIDKQFDIIINQLLKRKNALHEQVGSWKSNKLNEVSNEIQSAGKYEETVLNAQKKCTDILLNDKLNDKHKKNEIKFIKKSIKIDEKYRNSNTLTKHINNLTKLIDIDYQNHIDINDLSAYGNMIIKENDSISVPTLNLLKPIKIRESKSGYKLKIKWTTSHPLIADNFIIRCLTLNKNQNQNNDDEKSQQHSDINIWKSLIFQMKAINEKSNEFETLDIDSVFLFDKTYIFRVEYHLTDPVNLLIGSNTQQFIIENLPPSSNKAEYIELEYVSCKGFSYEGHPKYLLSENTGKKYRSKPNKMFNWDENDWIIFKLKYSGYSRTYLPKAIRVKNCLGSQGLRELIVYIGSKADGNEWLKYKSIEFESGDSYQQSLLEGVDWKLIKEMRTQYIRLELICNHGESRGAQCRFKVHEFQLYGLEFK